MWPPALARAADMTTSAAAPSLREEALPAVTTPPSRWKAGLSEGSFFTSIVVYCSSVAMVSSPWFLRGRCVGGWAGVIGQAGPFGPAQHHTSIPPPNAINHTPIPNTHTYTHTNTSYLSQPTLRPWITTGTISSLNCPPSTDARARV